MLKRLFFISAFAAISTTNFSQVLSDSVTMAPGYANQVYYELSSGTKTISNSTNWDLQFSSNLMSGSIRINGGQGVELFEANTSDTANFATSTIDTSSLTNQYDGYLSWEQDAFTAQATGHPNYGWGIYTGAGNLTGIKVYVIKLTSGVLKKIWIRNFIASGNIIFSIADLDGSNMTTKTLNRSTYSTKRFFYYDVENDSILDSEPAKASWDFVFRKYSKMVAPGTYYNVTGALTNANIGVAQVDNTPTADAKTNYSNYSLDSSINILGYDWKSFNMSTFSWDITDSLSYIIKNYNEDVWQVIFTGTTGSSQGKMYFTKEKIATVSLEENTPVLNVGVYPNPTSSVLNINFELVNSSFPAMINLFDMNGRVVKMISNDFQNSGFNQLKTDISELQSGVYFLQIKSGSNSITKRVVKQ
ncbi:MAG: T9SS type A sorting domain-containing protein [Flavobacteriales bacterium]